MHQAGLDVKVEVEVEVIVGARDRVLKGDERGIESSEVRSVENQGQHSSLDEYEWTHESRGSMKLAVGTKRGGPLLRPTPMGKGER